MNTRAKWSKIWILSKETFAAIVATNSNVLAIQQALGYAGTSGTVAKMILQRIQQDSLDISHFGQRNTSVHRSLKNILVKNSTYTDGTRIKKRLIAEGILENKCAICGLLPIWQDKPITLQLDHKNGIHNDNRVKNLRIICPNCHTQTHTYAGKNINKISSDHVFDDPAFLRTCKTCNQLFRPTRYAQTYCSDYCWPSRVKNRLGVTTRHTTKAKEPFSCLLCGKEFTRRVSTGAKYCSYNCADKGRRKVGHPDTKTLRRLVWEKPVDVLAKQLGVSGVAIKKWCRAAGIETPGRGYWAQVKAGKIKPKVVK
jgi:hypothetical protein